jgi:organic hydroperoxide reductase OsmC/OhrA
MSEHTYNFNIDWTGDQGQGTAHYRAYSRNFEVRCENKPNLLGSADPAFRGDSQRYNPEELLIAALSSCHMLSYLHLCADAHVVVTDYRDEASGTMVTRGNAGAFREVTLRPHVTVAAAEMIETAQALHGPARDGCFIANSVNFPVLHEPTVAVRD